MVWFIWRKEIGPSLTMRLSLELWRLRANVMTMFLWINSILSFYSLSSLKHNNRVDALSRIYSTTEDSWPCQVHHTGTRTAGGGSNCVGGRNSKPWQPHTIQRIRFLCLKTSAHKSCTCATAPRWLYTQAWVWYAKGSGGQLWHWTSHPIWQNFLFVPDPRQTTSFCRGCCIPCRFLDDHGHIYSIFGCCDCSYSI